jgi:hypothetical protein
MIAGEFAVSAVAAESDKKTFSRYTPGCFGEQIGNKGLAGKECERVRNSLKILGLQGCAGNAFFGSRVR